jgi:WD40 repeat protein/serine/threonine protein kinase
MASPGPNLDSLFDAAVGIASPEERAAFLAQACGDNTSLRQEVERLLAADQAAASFLEQPTPELDVTIVPGQLDDARAAALNAGLAAAFPADAAVVFGDAHHSVLKSLSQSMVVPRVALREAVGLGNDPIVRPKSSEMPDRNSDSRYQLQGEIARGGMGAILKGRDTDLGRDLAIKVLLDVHKDKPEVVQRFIEEAQIGGQLQHPGIAPIYELGQFADRRPFFSMKLVKGDTLSKLLADRAEPSADRGKFLGIFEQICQTMAYAHSRGVIHRDLKPANVMVGAFGEVQVMDWGLAKVLPAGGVADEKKSQLKQQGQSIIQTLRSKVGSDTPGTIGGVGSQTQMGSVMGTPAYMPPEQALGEIDHLDERADVFGLGAILCEVLTGKPPYVGDDGTQVFRMASRGKLSGCFDRLDSCGADAELITLTKQCLELEPQDRPRDAGVMTERISAYLESVETRLREADLARAAEAARAESEGKRAEAEGRRAEAERQRAESEGRRLEQQQRSASKLRKMLVGLAAVATIAVGASIVAGQFWQAANVAKQTAENNAELAGINAGLADKNAELAEKNAVAAQKNEAKALSEAGRANAQTQLANDNLIKAEKARVEADENRKLLRAERDQGLQKLYFAEMILAGISAEAPSGLGRVRELLGSWGPTTPRANLRGWEWYHLDSQSRRAILTLRGHTGGVFAVAYSPDCQRLATGGSDNTARIWDTATGRQITCLRGHKGPLNGIAWSPDGKRLATASYDGTARIWDVATGQELRQLCGPGLPVVAIAWRSDGARVATTGNDMLFHIWDPDTGRELITPQGEKSWGMALAWSPDGKKLALGTWKVDAAVFDGETGAKVMSLKGHTHGVLGVNWSPAGDRLATASWDGAVRVWDSQEGKQLSVLNEAQNFLHGVCWSPDGKHIAAGGGNRAVQIWNSDSGRARAVLRGDFSDIRALAWSSDGASIAATAEAGSIHVWDVRPESDLFRANVQEGMAETGFDWARDGRTVTRDGDATIRVWGAASAKPSLTLNGGKRAPDLSKYGTNRVRFSPDGTKIVAGGDDKLVRIWDAASGELIRTLTLPSFPFNVQWSPDGNRLACSGWGWALAVWDVASGEPIIIPDVRQGGQNFALAWSPAGDRIATAGQSTAIRVWDSTSGRMVTQAKPKEQVWDVSWSPDGRQLASAVWDGSVHVWDTVANREMLSLRGHSGRVMSVGWSPDGKRIASGSSDRTIKLWDSVSGQETLTLRGHADTVTGIHWHPDGCRLATRDGQGNVLFWDATLGFMSERSASTLPQLSERIQRDPTHVPARQHRAEVLSRQGDWAAAALDFAELARLPNSTAVVYPAGWWTFDGPENSVPTFPPSINDAHAQWLAPADDPNGFVLLPSDRTTAVTRIFAPSRKWVVLDFDQILPERMWLNENAVDAANFGAILVELKEGWNSLAIRGGPPEQFVRWRDFDKPADNTERLRFARAAALAANGGDQKVLPLNAAEKAQLRGRALSWLKAALSDATNRAAKAEIIAVAAPLPELLRELAELVPQDAPFQAALARHFVEQRQFLDADAARIKARTLFTQHLEQEPENIAVAVELADLLLDPQWHADVRWTVIQPAEIQDSNAVKLTPQDDKSILVGPASEGPASKGEPKLVRWQSGPAPVQALRIETSSQTHTSTDDSQSLNEYQTVAANMATSQAGALRGQYVRIDLPGDNKQFPRHREDGDRKWLGLAELQVFQGDQNIAFRKRARQSSNYSNLLVAECAVDGNTIGNDQGNPYSHTLSDGAPWWEVDLGKVQAIDRIVVWNRIEFKLADRMNHFRVRVLDHTRKVVFEQLLDQAPNPSTEIVRPVLLVETDTAPVGENEPLTLRLPRRDAPYRLRVSVASSLADLSLEAVSLPADPWEKLAVAYHIVDDQQALKSLLERHPMVVVGIGDLHTANKNWDQAIAEYSKIITPESTTGELLTKRATAYLAIEKWDLAQADWRRIVAQHPDQLLNAFNEFKNAERWKEAVEFGLQISKQNPDDTMVWLTLAPILVLADDQAAYFEFCGRMVQHFAKSELLEAPDRVLKATLLRANSIDLKLLPGNKLADSLDSDKAPNNLKPFFWGTRALFAYRSGDAESAVKFVAKSEAHKPTGFYHLLNLSVLAMAQHQLQRPEDARRSLAEASKLLVGLRAQKGNNRHHDLLIGQILFREAETLINAKSK